MAQTIYLAGPMTGYPAYNVDAFRAAERQLRAEGYTVLSPIDIQQSTWRHRYGRDFNWETDRLDYGDALLRDVWASNVLALTGADALVFLDGWEQSKGARAEYLMARMLDIPCRLLDGTPILQTMHFAI